MTDYSLTKEQLRSISSDNSKILVSASAGTGKTFVMVQRILDLIAEKGKSIDSFLVVTFTVAAAEEMRSRIYAALNDKLEDDPSLKTQIKKLSTAAVSTLHSFCSDLIRRYFYAADLPPKFKVLDEAKAEVLKSKVLDDLLDDEYEKASPSFLRLTDILSFKRNDDALKNSISRLYEFARSMEDPKGFLNSAKDNRSIELYENIVLQDVDYEILKIKDKFFTFLLESAADEKDKIIAAQVNNAISAILSEKTLNGKLKIAEEFAFPSLSASKNAFHEEYKLLHNEAKKQFEEVLKLRQAAESAEFLPIVFADVAELVRLTFAFSDKYSAKKRESDSLDFSDLEHFALKLLKTKEVLEDVQGKYEYVFVDEYQDTSKVQEAIISLIASKNLFTVGDVKQSIYAFRHCDKDIFTEKELSYNSLGGEVIYLNDNFRSASKILYFVNEIFSHLMTKDAGADYKKTSEFNVDLKDKSGDIEIDVIGVKNEKSSATPKVYSVMNDKEVDDDLQTGEIEGKFIAEKIKGIVGKEFFDGKTLRIAEYSDCAILLRAVNNLRTQSLYKTLLEEGIPCTLSSSDALLYDYAEVEQVASFIRVMLNYKDDVPLLSVLKSPFFSFSDRELYAIKALSKTKFFHEALKYAYENDNPLKDKVTDFFDKIKYYSYVADGKGGSYAAKRAVNETPFMFKTLSAFKGREKAARVNEFLTKIDAVDENKSLPELISAMDVLKDKLSASTNSNPSGSVRIMTIHKSKGLEFPIVFLANAEKKFLQNNNKLPTLMHADLGIGLKYYDLVNRKKFDTLPYLAITKKQRDEDTEEALRLLYVALTRAKRSLFVTAVVTLPKKCDSAIDFVDGYPKSDDFYDCKSYLDFILSVGHKDVTPNGIDADFEKSLISPNKPDVTTRYPLTENAVISNINYRYPHTADTILPTKFAASNLKRDFFTETEVSYHIPDGVTEDKIKMGVYYHKLLQSAMPKADLKVVENALKAAIAAQEIDSDYADKLDLAKVVTALNLPIMSFGTPYAEKPFMISVDPKEFTEYGGNSQVLIQGVIDLLLVNGNDAVVIDYKYTDVTDPKIIQNRYGKQLKAYAYAVKNVLNLNVVKTCILNLKTFELTEITLF